MLQMTGDENYEHDLQEIVESIDVERKQTGEKLFTESMRFRFS